MKKQNEKKKEKKNFLRSGKNLFFLSKVTVNPFRKKSPHFDLFLKFCFFFWGGGDKKKFSAF